MIEEDRKGSARFLGSLRDALTAASREEDLRLENTPTQIATPRHPVMAGAAQRERERENCAMDEKPAASPSAAEAAREARGGTPASADRHVELDQPPTTRVVRGASPLPLPAAADGARTQLVRGRQKLARGTFHQDPVVGWLVVVGGPGLGSFRPIYEGNNTVGRAATQRIPIDFGDDTISSDEQAYIRYDSVDRSFLFVPNLAKTNVVSLNDKKPTAAVALTAMDVITMGRTQLVFVPFCGPEFDWSELADAKP